MKIFNLWIASFIFTLIIEVPIFILFARKFVPTWRGALAGMAGTCFTHPLLWFVWPFVIQHNYTAYIVSGELLVATIESLTFFALSRPINLSRAVAASFIANGASYGIGVIFQSFGLL